MDSEEIARRVESMKITSLDKVDPVLITEELTDLGQKRLESCLVAKVFSAKTVNRETFKTHMPRILQSRKDVKVEVVGENLFLLHFDSFIDRRQALDEGPIHQIS